MLNLNVKLKLIKDGDVAGAILVTDDKYDVDIFLGIGGGPEGVLAVPLTHLAVNFRVDFYLRLKTI